MINQRPDDSKMTPATCVSNCAKLGYGAAGLEYGVQCKLVQVSSIFNFLTLFQVFATIFSEMVLRTHRIPIAVWVAVVMPV